MDELLEMESVPSANAESVASPNLPTENENGNEALGLDVAAKEKLPCSNENEDIMEFSLVEKVNIDTANEDKDTSAADPNQHAGTNAVDLNEMDTAHKVSEIASAEDRPQDVEESLALNTPSHNDQTSSDLFEPMEVETSHSETLVEVPTDTIVGEQSNEVPQDNEVVNPAEAISEDVQNGDAAELCSPETHTTISQESNQNQDQQPIAAVIVSDVAVALSSSRTNEESIEKSGAEIPVDVCEQVQESVPESEPPAPEHSLESTETVIASDTGQNTENREASVDVVVQDTPAANSNSKKSAETVLEIPKPAEEKDLGNVSSTSAKPLVNGETTPVRTSVDAATEHEIIPVDDDSASGRTATTSIVPSISVTNVRSVPVDKDIEIINSDNGEKVAAEGGISSGLQSLQEINVQLCIQCYTTRRCVFPFGSSMLCSEECRTLFSSSVADGETIRRRCTQCLITLSGVPHLSWELMDFCKEDCLSRYMAKICSRCAYCTVPNTYVSESKFYMRYGPDIYYFCTRRCLDRYRNNLQACSFCSLIGKGVKVKSRLPAFCGQICTTKYLELKKDVADGKCAVCGFLKPVLHEVIFESEAQKICSEPCFSAFKFVNNFREALCAQCKKYFDRLLPSRVTIFADERPVHFCSEVCSLIHLNIAPRVVACVECKVEKCIVDSVKKKGVSFCSISCLRVHEKNSEPVPCAKCSITCVPVMKFSSSKGRDLLFCSFTCASSSQALKSQEAPSKPMVHQFIVSKPPEPKQARNKAIICKPYMHNKGTSCRPLPCHKETQTGDAFLLSTLIPIPVPIYVPAPIHMYNAPYPVPIPVPLPIPVPIFIPTTRNSAKGILKEIRKIQDKMPTDPFEAELLMMAEMVAGDKKPEATDSESDNDTNDAGVDGGDSGDEREASYNTEPDSTNTFGEDIMQIALKMASELDEPQVDMESVLTSNTITPSQQPTVDTKSLYSVPEEAAQALLNMRGRKRPGRGGGGGGRGGSPASKRGRRSSAADPMHNMHNIHNNMTHIHHHPPPPPEPPRMEVEKPDANMRLKYTFGVNAWRHWVIQKNMELEKAMLSNRKVKPFKPDLLQLTADELNFSLCLFVKEVKKPSGQEYAPDTIYYLCLGIQQYLFENGRIDNIFTDAYYEKFTDCLDEVGRKFAMLYNDSQYIVTRVEEEHLWESKQLGAHSPHVLLSTLMFFNTKHFNLVTVEEHMQLSFSHIMKHWKRNPNAPGVAKVPGSRNVLLRFYPPQAALEANSRKKKVYEQQENEENPLRCPVKLYEFYLSKCPESVKTRNDVFYLLPERSCVPDSPVWYSTMALGKEPLTKMLNRVKMVKEINVALLSS